MKVKLFLDIVAFMLLVGGVMGILYTWSLEWAILPEEPLSTPLPSWTTTVPPAVLTPIPTSTYPIKEIDRFYNWLGEDKTNEREYIGDKGTVYEERYVCAHFTRDFIKNATMEGFEVYAVRLTGITEYGVNEWHILAVVVINDTWFYVEPQNDNIIKPDEVRYYYPYSYAYFGKEIFISRNGAEISNPLRYHPIIGLNGNDFFTLE